MSAPPLSHASSKYLEAVQGLNHVRSYYAATSNPAPPRPPLEASTEVDVCIIGAGFTGLSTALHLAEKGHKVLVLEAAKVGWGATGRNGGQMVNGYSRDLDVMEERFGAEAARVFGALSLEGAAIIRRFIADYGIICDYKAKNLFAALTSKQFREMESRKKTWEKSGHTGLSLLDKAQLQNHVASNIYVGGLLDHLGGHLHPLNLALGEAVAIEKLGGRICEASKVTSVEEIGGQVIVRTDKADVKARFVIAAGNAYLGQTLPPLSKFVMPVSTQVVTTAPLGEKGAKAILPGDVAVEDGNYFLDYFRLTADKRLLFGGGTVYGGSSPDDIIAKLRPHIKAVFPHLSDIPIDFAWSGNFAMTLSRAPHLGRMGRSIYFAHGYSGHGVTMTHLAGRLIADAIDGDARQFDTFAAIPISPFPGGQILRIPLTVLGSWWYRLRDRLGV